MKFEFFYVVGVFVNLCVILVAPTLILGEDNFIGEGIIKNDDTNIITGDKYDNLTNSDFIKPGEKKEKIEDLTINKDLSSPINFIGDVFDWAMASLEVVRSIFLFFIPFLSVIVALPNPFNFFFGTLIIALFILAFVNWWRNR